MKISSSLVQFKQDFPPYKVTLKAICRTPCWGTELCHCPPSSHPPRLFSTQPIPKTLLNLANPYCGRKIQMPVSIFSSERPLWQSDWQPTDKSGFAPAGTAGKFLLHEINKNVSAVPPKCSRKRVTPWNRQVSHQPEWLNIIMGDMQADRFPFQARATALPPKSDCDGQRMSKGGLPYRTVAL